MASGKAGPLAGAVLDVVGQAIAGGAYAPGDRLTLRGLEAEFGVSRTVAREAMRALEQLGMVESSRRVGLTVLPMERWAVFDPAVIAWRLRGEKSRAAQLRTLNELRVAIEPLAARHCAEHASEADRAEILRLAGELCELDAHPSPKVGAELEVDLQFHTAILRGSRNEMFNALAPSLLAIFKGKSIFGSAKRDPVAGTAQLHLELARAIADSRADTAEALSRRILDHNRK